MTDFSGSVGIDVGGTKLLFGLVETTGAIVWSLRVETRPAHLIEDLAAGISAALERAAQTGFRVQGVGLGIKGTVDPGSGTLLRSMSLGLFDLPIAGLLSTRFDLPVFVENDVHASTYGELRFGLGRRHRNFIMYNAGTGISAGFVIDGRMHAGAGGAAGEIGHMRMGSGGGVRCKCGRSGCLEDLVMRSRSGEPVPDIDEAGVAGLSMPYRLLALGLVDLVNAFNPGAVACMGGMFLKNPAMVEALATLVPDLCLRPAAQSLAGGIVPAFGGYEAGLLGAGSLPFLRTQGARTPSLLEQDHVTT